MVIEHSKPVGVTDREFGCIRQYLRAIEVWRMAWLGQNMAIAFSQLIAVAADGILAIEVIGDW